MAQPCKAAMAARVDLGHLLDNFEDSRRPSLLSPRFRRVPVDGCRRIFAPRLLITRSNPSPKQSPNHHKNGLSRSAWAGRPRVFLARFGPIFRGRASLAIVSFCLLDCVAFWCLYPCEWLDVLSSEPLYLPCKSPKFYAFTLWSLGHLESCSPWVLTCAGLHHLLAKCSLNFSRKCSF
jgi:hypothetical protein